MSLAGSLCVVLREGFKPHGGGRARRIRQRSLPPAQDLAQIARRCANRRHGGATLPFAQGRSTGGALSQAILQGLAEALYFAVVGQVVRSQAQYPGSACSRSASGHTAGRCRRRSRRARGGASAIARRSVRGLRRSSTRWRAALVPVASSRAGGRAAGRCVRATGGYAGRCAGRRSATGSRNWP